MIFRPTSTPAPFFLPQPPHARTRPPHPPNQTHAGDEEEGEEEEEGTGLAALVGDEEAEVRAEPFAPPFSARPASLPQTHLPPHAPTNLPPAGG